MADFGAPIPQTNNVGQALQTLSGVLGLRQQQQALQTGAYDQQRVQAEAQHQQQAMQERQLLQHAMTTGTDEQGNSLKDANGDIDIPKATAFATRALPLTGQPILQNLIKTQTEITGMRSALTDLDVKQRGMVGNLVQATSSDPKASAGSFMLDLNKLIEDHPEMEKLRGYAANLIAPIDKLPPDQRGSYLLQLASKFQQQTPVGTAPITGQVDTGASIQPGSVNPQTGAFTPAGKAIGKTLSPQVVTQPGGIPEVWNGGPGGRPSPSAPSGPQPTNQDIENFGAYKADLAHRAGVASRALPQLQAAEDALSQMRAGAGSATLAKIAKGLQAIPGVPQSLVDSVANGNLAATQEAEKYLFLNTFSGLRQAMGGSPHVAEFDAAQELLPSVGTDPRATKEVLRFMGDQSKRDLAEQRALNEAYKSKAPPNPVTWQADYQERLRKGDVEGVPASQRPNATTGDKTVTMDDVTAYAKKHGLTPEAAKAHVIANGFKVQ